MPDAVTAPERHKTWRSVLTSAWDVFFVVMVVVAGGRAVYLAFLYFAGALDHARDLLITAAMAGNFLGVLALSRRPHWLHKAAAALAVIGLVAYLALAFLAYLETTPYGRR